MCCIDSTRSAIETEAASSDNDVNKPMRPLPFRFPADRIFRDCSSRWSRRSSVRLTASFAQPTPRGKRGENALKCGHGLHPIPLLRALVLAHGVVLVALGDALPHRLRALPLEGAGQRVGVILGGKLAFLLAAVRRLPHRDPPPVVEADLEPLLQVAASAQLDNVANRLGRPSLAGYAWRGRENMADPGVADLSAAGFGAK